MKTKKYMVVSRVIKGKKYAGSWHESKEKAIKFAKKLVKESVFPTKCIITTKPKKQYKF